MPEKAKNKNQLATAHFTISLHITIQKIIRLQNDTQALKIMFPATQND